MTPFESPTCALTFMSYRTFIYHEFKKIIFTYLMVCISWERLDSAIFLTVINIKNQYNLFI